jgi:hypothetical protein
MKKTLIILIAILAVGFIGYKMYNKPHTDVQATEVLKSFSAEELFTVFDLGEAQAMAQFADQVIGVNGVVYQKDFGNELEPQIVLEANGDNGYIRCGFKPEEKSKLEKIKEGQSVKVKGLCKGINGSEELDLLADIDVVMSNCIIIE